MCKKQHLRCFMSRFKSRVYVNLVDSTDTGTQIQKDVKLLE